MVAEIETPRQTLPRCPPMLQVRTDRAEGHGAEHAQPQTEVERLRADNARLLRENLELRARLDAYVARARATPLFGPVEMTAGTCIGPRRQRDGSRPCL